MDKRDLEERTKLSALRVIRFVSGLPRGKVTDVLGYQLLKSATSVAANYREANRAESRNGAEELRWLLQECNELLAIFTSAGKTAKARRK